MSEVFDPRFKAIVCELKRISHKLELQEEYNSQLWEEPDTHFVAHTAVAADVTAGYTRTELDLNTIITKIGSTYSGKKIRILAMGGQNATNQSCIDLYHTIPALTSGAATIRDLILERTFPMVAEWGVMSYAPIELYPVEKLGAFVKAPVLADATYFFVIMQARRMEA